MREREAETGEQVKREVQRDKRETYVRQCGIL